MRSLSVSPGNRGEMSGQCWPDRRAAHARSLGLSVIGPGVRRAGPLSVDTERLRFSVGRRVVRLTGFQMKLLLHFLAHPERVFSRQQLLASVWTHNQDRQVQNVDVAVCRLRKALRDAGYLIETVKHFGYRLQVPDTSGTEERDHARE